MSNVSPPCLEAPSSSAGLSSSSSSHTSDDEPWQLAVAFAVDAPPSTNRLGSVASPALRPRAAAANLNGVPPLALRESSDPTQQPQQSSAPSASPNQLAVSVSPPLNSTGAAPAHLPPFGFLSFPNASLSSVPASRVTLAQVRSILPTVFPQAHVASLISAGVLSSLTARCLHTGSYFFMCAQTQAGGAFLPVSPVQEEHLLAKSCAPLLVLKAMPAAATPGQQHAMLTHAGSSAHMLAPGTEGSSYAGKDFLPVAPHQAGRRASFDFSHSQMSHNDAVTLLDAGVPRSMPHFGSPPVQGRMLRGTSLGLGSSDALEADEKYDESEPAPHMPPGHLLRMESTPMLRSPKTRTLSGDGRIGSSSATQAYRSLAEGVPAQHFDDVIREKSSGHLLRGFLSPPAPADRATLRITVTGELLDTKPRLRADQRLDSVRARRNTNIGTDVVEDEREGSCKAFTSVEDFLRDEERRRAKYDAANAAYVQAQVAEEEAAAAAAAAAASNSNSDVSPASTTGSTPLPPSTPTRNNSAVSPAATLFPPVREPLAQTPLWISVEDADDRVVERIGRYFGLHPLTIEDCQSKGIREKLEVFPEYLFLVYHALEESSTAGSAAGRGAASASASSSSSRHAHSHSAAAASGGGLDAAGSEIMRTTPLKLVVFPSLVLSFHKGALPSVTLVRRQLDKLYVNRVLNTAWLIHGLLDVVSDSLMPVVDTATDEADYMEDEIYIINPGRESHKDVLRRMGAIARRLTFLRQRLWSKRDILTSLIEKDWQSFLTGVKVPYLRDIYDHLVIMLHKLDASIEVIVTLQSTYLAVVSIDVAAVSNDGNKAMKTLSAAATILLPLSLIASLMGMNVMVSSTRRKQRGTGAVARCRVTRSLMLMCFALCLVPQVPFNTGADRITFRDLLPFTTICICMLLISTSLYSYFKKQKYL